MPLFLLKYLIFRNVHSILEVTLMASQDQVKPFEVKLSN